MVLLDGSLHAALSGIRNCLRLEARALGTHAPRSVHGALKRITLPSEDVVSVLSQSCVVAGAEIEWLRSVCWPLLLVVKLGSVPDNLVHQLGNPDGMS